MTVATLQQCPRAQAHRLTGLSAARADEALWPTPLFKGLFALVLGSIVLEKFRQTQAFLKLNRVLRHQASPVTGIY